MTVISVRSTLQYQVESPTTLLVNVAVASTPHQRVLHELFTVTPFVAETPLPVGEERNRFVRLLLEPGETTIRYGASVELDHHTEEPPVIEETDYSSLPPNVLSYLNPSRYCESDRLANFALAEFGAMERNFERVNSICDWVHKNIEYRSGTTTSLSTGVRRSLAAHGRVPRFRPPRHFLLPRASGCLRGTYPDMRANSSRRIFTGSSKRIYRGGGTFSILPVWRRPPVSCASAWEGTQPMPRSRRFGDPRC